MKRLRRLQLVPDSFDMYLREEDFIDDVWIDVTLRMRLKDFEPNDFLPRYDVRALLYIYDEKGDEVQEELPIAWASVVLIDPSLVKCPLFYACDAESADLLDLYSNIYDEDEDLLPPLDQLASKTIWCLDEFIIEEGYQSIGHYFLKWIITYLTRKTGAMVVFPVPSKLEKKGATTEIVRDYDPGKINYLRWFYAHFGFTRLRDTDYMYLILE